MRCLKITVFLFLLALATVSSEEEEKGGGKSREKRQQIAFYPRRGPRPPPYAVQMEPIVQYSQRDPLYNPLANAKSDDGVYGDDQGSPIGYYQSEPEPIIEIIIKESNESLPTPAPLPQPQQTRPTKEPIQVFYVKYEKKKGHGDDKPRVVYDTPIPALNPVEEHEEIKPEHSAYREETLSVTSPAPPSYPEPSTTLRTVIRPDSEVYHAGSSGIRVTFGTEQVPPNQHNKRSDRDQDRPVFTPHIVPVGSSKRQHGPYQPLQPLPVSPIHRFPPPPPAHAQQRVVNSFPSLQSNGPQIPVGGGPGGFPPQSQQFQQQQQQQPQSTRIQNSGRPQRLPITIQGLPDIQQRTPFNPFNNRGSAAIQQQTPAGISISHQNIHHPSNQQVQNFNVDNQNLFKQQEIEKQRYYEQRRQQDLLRQQEQHRQRQQQEQIRIQEQQRIRQQEIDQKQIQEQLQFRQQQAKYNQQLQQYQQQQNQLPPGGEILKAVPKLEQHYAIRENPLHPGPFPPNPQPTQFSAIPAAPSQFPVPSQQPNSIIDGQQHFPRNRQAQFVLNDNNNNNNNNNQQITNKQQSSYQNTQQQYFSQNLPVNQQQQIANSASVNSQSIWESRPVFSRQNSNTGQKIYATPITNTVESLAQSSTTPSYLSSTKRLTSLPSISSTTEAPATTTTVSPKSEAKIQQNIANLPDEVPDDIREQLLSSGILGNADIQILDYDKVGDIPIENLPPEALANFYGAGGGAAAAASEPVPSIVKRPKIVGSSSSVEEKEKEKEKEDKVILKKSPKVEQATLRPGGVEMKVVHFDPNTAQGQAIADKHIREDATHLEPVKIGVKDNSRYNRYLPLKVSGAAFPLPDVPELNGRKITSVVVLAPVDYNFHPDGDQLQDTQINRGARKLNDVQAVRFLAGDALKQVVKKPNAENYKKWLEQESRADPQRQSVVLLVTMPVDNSQGEKEIFMYDVTTQAVSKLAGDLSTAFVDVAESNSGNEEAKTDIQDSVLNK